MRGLSPDEFASSGESLEIETKYGLREVKKRLTCPLILPGTG